jgi:hypothetical protein
MDYDTKLYNAITDKITEVYMILSDEAKNFVSSELLEDDIIDFREAISYYQLIIKNRLYMNPADEDDDQLIETMKILIQCYLDV